MNEELTVILLSAAPISELRGAIPVALAVFNFLPAKAYWLSIFGNLLPVGPLYLGLRFGSRLLMAENRRLDQFFRKLFSYTRAHHANRFNYRPGQPRFRPWLEALTLFVFVAIPLPITGVWSAVLAAFVFGVPLSRTFFSIAAGVLAAGLIVLSISLGIIQIV